VAFGVSIDAEGFDPADNWIHLEPGTPRTIRLTPLGRTRRLQGTVRAVNGMAPVPIAVEG
jgi:beta-mannosidase